MIFALSTLQLSSISLLDFDWVTISSITQLYGTLIQQLTVPPEQVVLEYDTLSLLRTIVWVILTQLFLLRSRKLHCSGLTFDHTTCSGVLRSKHIFNTTAPEHSGATHVQYVAPEQVCYHMCCSGAVQEQVVLICGSPNFFKNSYLPCFSSDLCEI